MRYVQRYMQVDAASADLARYLSRTLAPGESGAGMFEFAICPKPAEGDPAPDFTPTAYITEGWIEPQFEGLMLDCDQLWGAWQYRRAQLVAAAEALAAQGDAEAAAAIQPRTIAQAEVVAMLETAVVMESSGNPLAIMDGLGMQAVPAAEEVPA